MSQSLFAMAAAATAAVLPPVVATLRINQGTTIQPDGRVTPHYTPLLVSIRVQPATSADLEHSMGLNQSTQTRTIYMPGAIQGLERSHQFGGDTLLFEDAEWLVTGQPETWGNAQWSRLVVTRQLPLPSSL